LSSGIYGGIGLGKGYGIWRRLSLSFNVELIGCLVSDVRESSMRRVCRLYHGGRIVESIVKC
jgi:hypothetical protein